MKEAQRADWEKVKQLFLEISEIPRNSGQEKKIGAFILKKAEELKRPAKMDEAGNIWIGTFPGKKAEYLLQAHQDMVCVKEETCIHDFSKDPIRVEEKDGWLMAKGTSLGADNGIGMAYLLALLEEDQKGILEGIFTVGEEIGMKGVNALNAEDFQIQAQKLINLDTAWDQVMVEGSAMGVAGVFTKLLAWEVSDSIHWYEIQIDGLTGGHSGTQSYKRGANGIRLMAEFLKKIPGKWDLALFESKGWDNVISNHAEVTLGVPDEILFEIYFEMMQQEFQERYRMTDPNLFLKKREIRRPQKQLTDPVRQAVVTLLCQVQSGVLKEQSDKQTDFPEGMEMCRVHTSANPASVEMTKEMLTFRCHYRSMDETFFERKIWILEKQLAEETGASLEAQQKAAGWQPESGESLKQELTEAYRKVHGKKPTFVSIPATLECGEIKERLKIKEAVSVGPIMKDYHTPKERLQIESAAGLYQVLKEMLALA